MNYGFQMHGYKSGHQCLFSTISLEAKDQDIIDRLSDISGPLRPGESFQPYFTCYPLPSKKYFVIARTWQDLEAPRAGCVITKSIISPIDYWENGEDTASLFSTLVESSSSRSELIKTIPKFKYSFFPVKSTPVNELVEALFLENRQPIVFYNCSEAEQIALRLYSVFWKSLKGTFSLCTFALSQRTLEGKPFDLLFAPYSAKARFAEFSGRRIEGNSAPPRHRWTAYLSNSIFKSDIPFLFQNVNEAIISGSYEDFNENTLRINLLWNELIDKAKSDSPYLSVLGLLDIINSQSTNSAYLYEVLSPYITYSISSATEKLDPLDAWGFYTSFLLRYKSKLMDREIFETIRISSSRLATKDPTAAINFITSYQRPLETIPSLLFAGMGDGLGAFFQWNNDLDTVFLENFKSNLSILLASASDFFSKIIVQKTDVFITEWENVLLAIVSSKNEKRKIKALKNISSNIYSDGQFNTFSTLLRDCSDEVFNAVIKTVSKNMEFKFGLFEPLVIYHINRLQLYKYFIKLLIFSDENGGSDSLLTTLLKLHPEEIELFCSSRSVNDDRKSNVLNFLFGSPSTDLINFLGSNQQFSYSLIESSYSKGLSEDSFANVLISSKFSSEYALNGLDKLSAGSIIKLNKEKIDLFLRKVLSDDSFNFIDSLVGFLRKIDSDGFDLIFRNATSSHISSGLVFRNIHLLLNISDSFRQYLVQNVNIFSTVIARNIQDNISDELAYAWIKLLEDARLFKKIQKETAFVMLDFSFRCNNYDPSELIEASFPIVYKSFLKGKPITNFLFFFSDWDKCRTLREDLVKLYLAKAWSKLGLISIAYKANILKEIINILIDKKHGYRLLEEAISEAKALPNKEILLNEIYNVLSNPHD